MPLVFIFMCQEYNAGREFSLKSGNYTIQCYYNQPSQRTMTRTFCLEMSFHAGSSPLLVSPEAKISSSPDSGSRLQKGLKSENLSITHHGLYGWDVGVLLVIETGSMGMIACQASSTSACSCAVNIRNHFCCKPRFGCVRCGNNR